jgi:hypothetical protein
MDVFQLLPQFLFTPDVEIVEASEALPEALESVRRLALPWFKEWGRIGFLLGGVERSISERISLNEAFEPLSADQQRLIALTWHRLANSGRRVAPMHLYYASILHYLAGDRDRAIARTEDWLATISPIETKQKEDGLAQLFALRQIQ